jgi:hypothetical protein
MKNNPFFLAGFLILFFSQLYAQESFESRANLIASKIENVTKEEKLALKYEVELVNIELEKNNITKEQADEKKAKFAEVRAKNIETRVAVLQTELLNLVQEKVDGKIKEEDSTRRYSFTFPSMKISDKYKVGENRTTSQFVFAFGVNNLVTNKAVANSDFRYWGSHFYEWGFTLNSRLLKNNNLLHAKYGFSFMYNNLRPTDNRYFVVNGNQTNLEVSATHFHDSRFRNVYLVVPMHLEFDFSKKTIKDETTYFRTHQSFRIGLGGYVGGNIKSKQILCYVDENGNDVTQKTKGDFNVNDFIYGASTYIGYKAISVYAKYDLNPLFRHNVLKQNNISLGLRFDFN